MSESKKRRETPEGQEKVLTKYDLKMQRRKEQKKKEQRDKKIAIAVGILLAAGLVCLLASFPIRSYMTVHGTYIVVGGENVTRVEFEYNYNLVKNNYLAQNGAYLSYFGVDLTGDLSAQMYSDTLTWQDYFEEMAVDNIVRTKGLLGEMEANAFTYDSAQEYAEYEAALRQAASEEGMTLGSYVQGIYGPYATLSRIQGFVKTGICTSAYYRTIADSLKPSRADVEAYYRENTDAYDSVDYRLLTVEAELPTEPTELADPVEESEGSEDDDETVYEPSEAEIAAAMDAARQQAEELLDTVLEDGELHENLLMSETTYLLQDWLFDSARKPGDTTVIANETANLYYVVAFEKRYLDQTPTQDVRVIMLEEGDGQSVLDEWKAGEATEESFAALADQYNSALAGTGVEGGLFEAQTPGSVAEEVGDWLFDESRAAGDTTVVFSAQDGVTYVLYYVGTNDPEWVSNIQGILLNERMTAYMEGITAGIAVEDPRGNLYYLQVRALEAIMDSDTESSSEE